MDEVMMWYTLGANFASGVGPCTGIVDHLSTFSVYPPTLISWHLSCDRPWALAWDNTVAIRVIEMLRVL